MAYKILILLTLVTFGQTRNVGFVDHSNWMKHLDEDLRNIPLNQLSIPGSHNSGAYKLNETGPLASDQPQVIKDQVRTLGPLARHVVHQYSKTQHLDTTRQLQAGIRFFDIRAAILDFDFHVYHGFYGDKLDRVLREMNAFLESHDKEVIFVAMNRRLDFTNSNSTNLAQLITTIFADKIFAPPETEAGEVTLNDVWRVKKQVLVFFNVEGNSPFWPLSAVDSPWFNVVESPKLVARLNERLDTLVEGKFNVFQAILSPDDTYVQANIGKSLQDLTNAGNKAVADWLDSIYEDCFKTDVSRRNVTVLWTDFVGDEHDVPSKVIRLNRLKQGGGCSGCGGRRFVSWLFVVVLVGFVVTNS